MLNELNCNIEGLDCKPEIEKYMDKIIEAEELDRFDQDGQKKKYAKVYNQNMKSNVRHLQKSGCKSQSRVNMSKL